MHFLNFFFCDDSLLGLVFGVFFANIILFLDQFSFYIMQMQGKKREICLKEKASCNHCSNQNRE